MDNIDYGTRAALISAALKRAREQEATPMPQMQMMGRFAVGPTGGDIFNTGIQRALGGYSAGKREQELAALNDEQMGKFADISQQLSQPGSVDYTDPASLVADNARRQGLASQMSQLSLPQAQKVAQDYLQRGVNFPDTMAQLQTRQIEAGNQNAMRLQEAARLASERADAKERSDALYRLTAEQQAGLRQSQIDATSANQQARLDAAKAKVDEGKAKVEEGKARATDLLNQLETNVDILDKNKGITSTKRGVLDNAVSWAQNTGPGQVLGKMGGTTNQSARNNIESLATNLVLELKNVKGLGASQMNSNMELQRYLTAVAGGNNYDAESLREVVKNARSLLGVGSGGGGGPARPTPPQVAIEKLRANPQLRGAFIEKYGEGALPSGF
jgi:hypothetical protein